MISGTTCNCSKFSLSSPIRNPKRLNVRHVNTKRKSINNGYWISSSTKKVAVMSIMTPTISDLVALAPTNPMIISKEEIGAARTS